MEYPKITKKNNSKTVTSKNDKEIPKENPKERYIFPEEGHKIFENIRSIITI